MNIHIAVLEVLDLWKNLTIPECFKFNVVV